MTNNLQQTNIADVADGLYFGMSDDTYHAVPRLSASGVKRLLVSGMDFWAWSWMNPNKPQIESEALTIGKAYHKRILEGQAAFDSCFAPAFVLDETIAYVETIDDMKEILERHGIKLLSKAKKADYIEAVKELPEKYFFKDEMKAEYESHFPHHTFLSAKLIEQINICAAMVENHPQLSKAVTGGYPEVSVFWTCNATGVKMKARMDYLKVLAMTDLKTFTNKFNKTIDKAIYWAMAGEKYHVQSGVYYEACDYAREFARKGLVNGEVDPAFVEAFGAANPDDTKFLFIFQQKGIAPVTRGKIMPKMSIHDVAVAAITEAKESFNRYMATFGTDPWLDVTDIGEFQDSEFPAFITDL